jgi:hypothetical protein
METISAYSNSRFMIFLLYLFLLLLLRWGDGHGVWGEAWKLQINAPRKKACAFATVTESRKDHFCQRKTQKAKSLYTSSSVGHILSGEECTLLHLLLCL